MAAKPATERATPGADALPSSRWRSRGPDDAWNYLDPSAHTAVNIKLSTGLDLAELDDLIDRAHTSGRYDSRDFLLGERERFLAEWNRRPLQPTEWALDIGELLALRLKLRRWRPLAKRAATSLRGGLNKGSEKATTKLFREIKGQHPEWGPKAIAEYILANTNEQPVSNCFRMTGDNLHDRDAPRVPVSFDALVERIKQALKRGKR